MQNDPSTPGAPPSRGFASIITLVSDVSKDLAALEQAPAEPPPPRVAPSPQPWVAPSPYQPTFYKRKPDVARSINPPPVSPDTVEPPWFWFYMLIAFIILLSLILSSK